MPIENYNVNCLEPRETYSRWALFDDIIDKEKLDKFINKHSESCHSNFAGYTFTLRPADHREFKCQIRCDECLEVENLTISNVLQG